MADGREAQPIEGAASDRSSPGILCLAHLQWNHVWQRPQQILTRLSRHYPVHYVAEPMIDPSPGADAHLRLIVDTGRLRAWQPIFPDQPEIIGAWRVTYIRLVQELLRQEGWALPGPGALRAIRPIIGWLYTPTPWYMLDHLPIQRVVYDVMDELASFKGAAGDLMWREAQLMDRADLVFACGLSLYNARKDCHPRVHLFPSGVDPRHFAAALAPSTAVPPETANLPRPVLGYYGVIDERIDLDLIRDLAIRRPDWSIVMVGPLAKIDPDALPVAPNLLYLGGQPYARLPAFLKGFDVCLMPFAMNEATRSISPTKALEYMAARKPIVSTPVPDVVATWSGAVRVAGDTDAFLQAVEAVLGETATERASRLAHQDRAVAGKAWERITEQMRELIVATL